MKEEEEEEEEGGRRLLDPKHCVYTLFAFAHTHLCISAPVRPHQAPFSVRAGREVGVIASGKKT